MARKYGPMKVLVNRKIGRAKWVWWTGSGKMKTKTLDWRR